MSHNWPSREQWAKNVRTFRDDDDIDRDDFHVSRHLADWASPAEIATAIVQLEQRWKELGAQMRSLKDDVNTEFWKRISLRGTRREIRLAIKRMKKGDFPYPSALLGQGESVSDQSAVLAEVDRKREAARQVLIEEHRRKVESTPIDDEAWQRELERRARFEAWAAGDKFVQIER